MKFVDFRLTGFAQHRDTSLSFADGSPSLILGPNESGKSQLLSGLIGTIFGLLDWKRYEPWNGEPALHGELRLDVDGHDIRLDRHFADNQVIVTQDGARIYQGRGLAARHSAEDERYQSLLAGWFGISDMELFRGVAFIEQDQLADKQLTQRSAEIKRLISGAREASYESAIADLGKDLDRLKRLPNKRNDREIELLAAEIADLEQRASRAAGFEAEAIVLDESEQQAIETLQRNREHRATLTALIDTYGERRRLREEIQRQTTLLGRLARDMQEATQSETHRQALEAEATALRVPGDPNPADIRADLGDRTHAVNERDKVRSELAELETEIAQLQAAGPVDAARRSAASARASLLATAAALALLSLVLGLLVHPALFAGLLLAAVIGVLALRSAPSNTPEVATGDGIRLTLAEQQRARLREELDEANAHLAEITARGDIWLNQSGEPDLDHLITRLERRQDLLVRLSEQRTPNPGAARQRQAEHDGVVTEVAILRRQLEQLDQAHPEGVDLTPERIAGHQTTLTRLDAEKERGEEDLSQIRVRRGVLRSTAEDDAAALSILIRDKQADLLRKRRLAQALDLAIETMRSCVQDFQEHALDPVADQAGALVRQITDGRYRRVEIDQQTMTPSVSRGDLRTIDVDVLSRGTQDQIYLAVRVGLVDALSGGRQLPIIFDDPCVHFDEERLAATIGLLNEIARERQVVLLTKDESYSRWYQPVLRLQRQRTEPVVDVSG